MPREPDAAVIRGGWRARGGVTSELVSARISWLEARGGPCEARRLGLVLNRARVVMRSFQSGVDSLLTRCGGRAENTRADNSVDRIWS